MLTQTLIKLFKRNLKALIKEVNLYKDEKILWIVTQDISNCSGNLCLHLIGNLNHFIGAAIGNSGCVRQHDLEFSLKAAPKLELIKQIDATIIVVQATLSNLTEDDLLKEYKHRITEDKMITGYFLVHLSTNLAYHLGQINYHRRLLDN